MQYAGQSFAGQAPVSKHHRVITDTIHRLHIQQYPGACRQTGRFHKARFATSFNPSGMAALLKSPDSKV